AVRARAPDAVGCVGAQQALLDDLVEQLAGIVVELLRARLVEDLWIAAAQFPGGEEWGPVDVWFDFREGNVVESPDAEMRRRGRRRPTEHRFSFAGLGD